MCSTTNKMNIVFLYCASQQENRRNIFKYCDITAKGKNGQKVKKNGKNVAAKIIV